MANFFKKKGTGQVATSSVQIMSDSEAALAQSDFNIEKITEIQNKFTGDMVLLYPGRIFIREGLLWKVCRKGPKRDSSSFLTIFLYGSVVANRYSNQHILPLTQMSVSAECYYQPRVNAAFDEDSEQMELDVSSAFQISHANKSFHVFALSNADKANWLANLHKHINKVAQSRVHDCSVKFTAFVRKHHCRRCGRVVCSTCSPHRMTPNIRTHECVSLEVGKLERTCKDCFKDMSSRNSRLGGQQPPPAAAIAAKVVSSVLQSASIAQSDPKPHDSSTDTDEDSDDSEEEDAATVASVESDNATPAPVPENQNDLQPTPPPRKKKIKKKLEQLLEQKLYLAEDTELNVTSEDSQLHGENSELCDKGFQQRGEDSDSELHDEDSQLCGEDLQLHSENLRLHGEEFSEDSRMSHEEDFVVKSKGTEDSAVFEESKSPKKSRRRRKHMQGSVADTACSEAREISANCSVAGTAKSDTVGVPGAEVAQNVEQSTTTVDLDVKKRSRKTKFK